MVVTTLAMGGVMLAGGFGDGNHILKGAPELLRRHVYIDTTGLNAASLTAVVAMPPICGFPSMMRTPCFTASTSSPIAS